MDNPYFNGPIQISPKKSTITESIIFRPTSWSCVEGSRKNSSNSRNSSSRNDNNKRTGRNKHPCGIFGYTRQGISIYIKIVPPTIYLLEYSEDVTDQTLAELCIQLGPESIGKSENNSKVVILSNPIVNPQQIEIESSSDYSKSQSGNTSMIATWDKSVNNPYGFLSSLFSLKRLSPYVWMRIENYSISNRKYTTANIEIFAHYNQLSYTRSNEAIHISRFYWDLEVFSGTGQFPEASNPADGIFMGSGSHRSIGKNNDYLFHLKKMDHIHTKKEPQPIVIEMRNEGELIKKIITINRTLKIDRSYTYNGYGFDSPYIVKRSLLLKQLVPSSGKIRITKRPFIRKQYKGFLWKEFGWGLFLPGIEQLDLLPFFRKFYPGQQNYKLDTMGKKFTGVGKTGLTIPELNKFYLESDPKGLKIGGEYALQDSILLADLQDKLKIDYQLEKLANQVGITTEDILRFDDQEIVDRYIYQLDPGLYFKRGKSDTSPHLSLVKPGLYQPIVYIYDYTPLYIRALMESKNPLNTSIAIGLSYAYPALIYKMFYSRVIDRTLIDNLLVKYLLGIHSGSIFARTEYLIYSVAPLTKSNVSISEKQYMIKLVNTYKRFLSISKTSYIILDNNNDMIRYGPSDISNPPYPFAKNIIDQYLKSVFNIGPPVKTIQFESNMPLEQLIMTTKIKDITKYNSSSYRKSLAKQFGQKITTWIEVKWVYTNRGPFLLSEFNKIQKSSIVIISTTGEIRKVPPLVNIDYYWYRDTLVKILKKITDLPIYVSPKPAI
uniref:DNA polymerase family B, exonuclease domain n=1 Tax=Pithovirus LCPAC202 TaxID=2506592 RepID=A0A481Z6J8_9VIRU|nr:MAG: DNA polymerase family B, exonuclease domain [Pithovirus LCPAC202]